MDGQSRGDGGRGDDGRFDDLPPVDVIVPDDAGELGAEVVAVQRELRRERRRARVASLFFTRRWRRFGLSGPLVVIVLLLVGLVASTLGVLRPRQLAQRPAALPLADTIAPAGEVGGLLPAAAVSIQGSTHDSRDLRPAVLVVVPADCGCDQRLDAVFRQAGQYGLPVYLVGDDGTTEAEIDRLADHTGNGTAIPVIDEGRTFAGAYGGRGITAILVHADGVIRAVHRDLPAGVRLEPELALLPSAAER